MRDVTAAGDPGKQSMLVVYGGYSLPESWSNHKHHNLITLSYRGSMCGDTDALAGPERLVLGTRAVESGMRGLGGQHMPSARCIHNCSCRARAGGMDMGLVSSKNQHENSCVLHT